MPEPPMQGRAITAITRTATWGPSLHDTRPTVVITRTGHGLIATGGEGWGREPLLAAGFRPSAAHDPWKNEYEPNGQDDATAAARALAALSVTRYPTTVDPGLFAPPTNLLPHLTTAALTATIETIGTRPGTTGIDTFAHLLLDPHDGALERLRAHLADAAARCDRTADHAQADRLRRAATRVDEAARASAVARVGPPSTENPGASASAAAFRGRRSASGSCVAIRRDGALTVAETTDPVAAEYLGQAGFGQCAFTDHRYLLGPGDLNRYVQARCVRAVRLLATAGIDADIEPGLLASANTALDSWSSADLADTLDHLARDTHTDIDTLAHLLLDPDGMGQRVHEHLETLTWELAAQGATARAIDVLRTSRRLEEAVAIPAPAAGRPARGTAAAPHTGIPTRRQKPTVANPPAHTNSSTTARTGRRRA